MGRLSVPPVSPALALPRIYTPALPLLHIYAFRNRV